MSPEFFGRAGAVALALLVWSGAAGAATTDAAATAGNVIDLKRIFELAWARHPDSRTLAARQDAAAARRAIAESWTAAPPALELSEKNDRLNRNQGNREFVIGVAAPLWLPGERTRAAALAESESRVVDASNAAARLRLAGVVRDAWWSWARARVDHELADDRLRTARALANDVARRFRAGDLSRADQHQADGHVAATEAAVAESRGILAAAESALRSLTGIVLPLPATLADRIESEPTAIVETTAHPEVDALDARYIAAREAVELARLQKRGHPELSVATTRDRGASSEPFQQTMTLALRLPFGSAARHREKVAIASAEALEAESIATIVRERVQAERDAAKTRLDAARRASDAAVTRARLARETRQFFEKSFIAGETDLPTRLRIERESIDAERQAARARIELGAAVSALRQVLGLLPE